MKLVGVVAEYNPFTLGHAHHLAEARRISGADGVVVVMSSTFVQRGAPALLSPHARAEMALQCGADAVLALPVMWSVREAEWFAMGAVSLLHQAGVEALSFGTETNQPAMMQDVAQLLEHPPEPFRQLVRHGMDQGRRHPQSLALAAEQLLPGAGNLLSTPNSTLGICYLRALIRLGSSMEICPVPRQSDYHSNCIQAPLPSATALRKAVQEGAFADVQQAMPPAAYEILQRERNRHRIMPSGGLDQAMMYRLRIMKPADFLGLPGISEGMENLLIKQLTRAADFSSLMALLQTRRYPAARFRRMCTHSLLGITSRDLETSPLPGAAHLLGFRSPAVLREISRRGLPLYTNPKKIPHSPPWVRVEERGYDVWTLGIGGAPGMMSTASAVTPHDLQSAPEAPSQAHQQD